MVRLVGQGAWATVYEAINVRIQRRVAIKILNIELATQPELHARFAREAEAATQIESPFVVTVFDAGTLVDGRPYIVMEFLEGEDLGKRLKRLGPLSEEVAANYAIHLLSGLADAHATGILHRDIKPDNLVIVKSKHGDEVLKLVDFGISKPNVARPEMLAMTKADSVLGSPVYMSPEQARGTRHMDHRSDLYSVGVVLFEALTRELPHDAENFNELMFKVALEDAPDPRTKRPDLDPAMSVIVLKALARDPSARFQSAVEFRDALVMWAETRGLPSPANPYATSKVRVRTKESGGFAANAADGPANPGLYDVQTSSSVRASNPTPLQDPKTASSLQASATPSAPQVDGPAKGKRLAVVFGAAAIVLMGVGLTHVLTRGRPQPSRQPSPVTTASMTPPTATTSTPSTTVPVEPANASAAATNTISTAVESAPPGSVVTAPTVTAPSPLGKRWLPPITSASTPPTATATVVSTAQAATPASSAVVEGRTIHTSF